MPEPGIPAGYASLIERWDLDVPIPRRLAFVVNDRKKRPPDPAWQIFSERYRPDSNLRGDLTFALKYEGLDLALLKRLFLKTGPKPIEEWVRSEPTGAYARRIWFLYEWLLGESLDLPHATSGAGSYQRTAGGS